MTEQSSGEPLRGTIRLLSTGPIHVEGNLPLAVGKPLEVMPVSEHAAAVDAAYKRGYEEGERAWRYMREQERCK